MGTGAIAISLPFSCVLGLLSSMTSSTMGMLVNILNSYKLDNLISKLYEKVEMSW